MKNNIKNKKELTLGWEEWISLPEINVPAIKAKIDTGAKTSSIHAFMIEPYGRGEIKKVRFGVHPIPERTDIVIFSSGKIVDQREFTSSNGETEVRYVIETIVKIGEETWPIELSLTNRETMQYRMLIGRSALKDFIIVDPNLSCVQNNLSITAYDNIKKQKRTPTSLKIGILSREPDNYSTQRLIEAAENRNHLTQIIHTTRCYMNITSKRPQVYLGGKSLEGFNAIIPRIGSSITFYGMALVRQFEAMGVYTLNSAASIGAARDKLYAHQLLARSGIDMPNTGFARSSKATSDLIKFVGGAPLVVKLLEGTQGRGVVLAETKKAAESVMSAFRQLDADIMVQEFIKESSGSDIRAFVVGDKVVAAMKRTAPEGEFRSNVHRGGTAERINLTEEEVEIAVRSCAILGLSVAGVDLMRSDRGPLILEVNSSPGLQGIESCSNVDVAEKIIHYIEKELLKQYD